MGSLVRPHAIQTSRAGFSLVELILSLGIFAIVSLFLYEFQINILTFTKTLSSQLTTQQNVRTALNQMVAELRTTAQSDAGAYPIESAATSSIVFYANVDTDSAHERIRYFLQGGILKRGVIQPTGNPATYPLGGETVTDLAAAVVNGTSSIFGYYDKNYTGTSNSLPLPIDVLAVRYVKITISLDETAKQPGPITVTSGVTIRNLKDNY